MCALVFENNRKEQIKKSMLLFFIFIYFRKTISSLPRFVKDILIYDNDNALCYG